MSRVLEVLLTDLRHLIADLGKDGGQIGPSVYNTAQHIRLAPPAEGVWPAVEWLVKQQHADGGWGPPTMIMARDVPTLAAVLALHKVGGRKHVREAVSGGMTFLRRHAANWGETLPDDIPVGVELILPALLDEAALAGLPVPEPLHYTALRKLGERRRNLIGRLEPGGGSTASHSWEAWGTRLDPALLDESGGVGHSPAATAAWLRASAGRADLAAERAAATEYLRRACLATGTGLPGVAPGVWPYPRNEQTVSLFTLLLAGLLDEPALEGSLAPQVADLWQSLRPEGQGISDWFSSDGDITAMCFAVARHRGYAPDPATMRRYIVDGLCLTYPQELQPSLSATAHAAHALAALGENPTPLLDKLCARRSAERLWDGDKWHGSWTYITGHTISALLAFGRSDEAMAALPAILDRQKPNGSWGETEARDEETANVVIALLDIDRREGLPDQARGALTNAAGWLMRHYRPLREETGACWIGKELYRPRRIARTLQLAALLACVRGGYAPGVED
jgi:halimadienyl-diphosphate synthase